MSMLLTTLGLFLLTALCILHHLKRTQSGPRKKAGAGATAARPASPAASLPAGPPCPRCKTPLPAGAVYCPGCGVPQQIFELVAARTAGGETKGARRHALVRADVCVGCGTCVAACPEPGAIVLEGKTAVVDTAKCVGHGQCVEACPVGAVLKASGEAVYRIEVPEIGPDFQTNVPGLYIAGELGGRSLIKNAVNEGKVAVEQVARDLTSGPSPAGANPDAVDVVIVGSGPAGLSAGLQALQSGLSHAILEQGNLAESIRRYPRHKILMAEPVPIPLYGDLWVADGSKESLLGVWETIIANTGLKVRTGHRVENIVRKGELFHVQTGAGEVRARRVLLAMGRRGTPRCLGCPGEELPKVYYDIVEMEAFQQRRVLVVGGGDSAAESALGLANQPGTQVVLSYRKDRFDRPNERNRTKLEAAIKARKVLPLLGSQVREICPDAVVLDVQGQARLLPNDNVIVRIGGDPPRGFLERIGVRMLEKDVPLPAEASRVAHAS